MQLHELLLQLALDTAQLSLGGLALSSTLLLNGQHLVQGGNELLIGPGKISAEQAKLHAETEFEKYRVIQDQLYESDFDKLMKNMES